MRDTVWAILLTQVPIAIGCLWVAWEVRGIRRAVERLAKLGARHLRGQAEDPGDSGDRD